MGWSIDRHEVDLINRIIKGDWEGVDQLAEEAAAHDKDVAERTKQIFWDHKHLA